MDSGQWIVGTQNKVISFISKMHKTMWTNADGMWMRMCVKPASVQIQSALWFNLMFHCLALALCPRVSIDENRSSRSAGSHTTSQSKKKNEKPMFFCDCFVPLSRSHALRVLCFPYFFSFFLFAWPFDFSFFEFQFIINNHQWTVNEPSKRTGNRLKRTSNGNGRQLYFCAKFNYRPFCVLNWLLSMFFCLNKIENINY